MKTNAIPRDVVERVVGVRTHADRRAARRARDALPVARIPKRSKPGVRPEHTIPNPCEFRERDVELRACLPIPRRVDAVVEVAESGEDRLHERVASGGVRASPVHVRDEEGAAVRRGASENANLLKDNLGGRVQVSVAVTWSEQNA